MPITCHIDEASLATSTKGRPRTQGPGDSFPLCYRPTQAPPVGTDEVSNAPQTERTDWDQRSGHVSVCARVRESARVCCKSSAKRSSGRSSCDVGVEDAALL